MTEKRKSGFRKPHTKSRHGCSNCKRRHVRCDETLPHCRNCLKQRLECDYMSSFSALNGNNESTSSIQLEPKTTAVILDIKRTRCRRRLSRNSSDFVSPSNITPLNIPQRTICVNLEHELALLSSLSRTYDDLVAKERTCYTMWAQEIPIFMDLANTHPCVKYALLAFSVNSLADSMNAQQVQRLHNQFSSTAFRELRDSFTKFSSMNADALVAASTLLSWQASSWQTWTSLRSGIQTALTIIQTKGYQCEFSTSTVRDTHLSAEAGITQHYDISETKRTLGDTLQALQRLRSEMNDSETEFHLISSLVELVQQLRSSYSAKILEVQVNVLGQLRQLLLWGPTHLLEQLEMKASTCIALSHFYATAVALEPIFSEWGPILCGTMALHSLDRAARSLIKLLGSPSAIEYGNDVYVFYRGEDGGLYFVNHIGRGTGWGTIQKLSDYMSESAAVLNANNRLWVFDRSASGDQKLHFKVSADGSNWSTERTVPNVAMTASPAPSLILDTFQESFYVFYQGMNECAQAWYSKYNGSKDDLENWSSPKRSATKDDWLCVGTPAVIGSFEGPRHFLAGTNAALWQCQVTGSMFSDSFSQTPGWTLNTPAAVQCNKAFDLVFCRASDDSSDLGFFHTTND